MEKITDLSQLDPNGVYTYADYLTWQIEQAIELVKGKILKMAAPSRRHQGISWNLSMNVGQQFKRHACRAYAAPFDVRLYDKKKSDQANKDIYTVVQPDLCIICDLSKLDDRGCLGAPDFIVEILSPGNSSKEMKLKKNLYEETGVREYWIIDPEHETAVTYYLQNDGTYSVPSIFVSDDVVNPTIFPDFSVELEPLFENL